MRYLFVHQSFPAQYSHILRYLLRQGGHELVFITASNCEEIPGIRRVLYNTPEPSSTEVFPLVREFEQALRRADAVARVAHSLKKLGYTPDIIIGHHGWGEMLNLVDVYPDVPILGYFEFFYNVYGQDVNFDPEFFTGDDLPALVRTKNAVNLQALTLPGWGQTPTQFQHQTYPAWAREQISVIHEGVDLDFCSPDKTVFQGRVEIAGIQIEPHEKLVTYSARDLEPYRGFHNFMRAIPDILRERKDTHIIIAGRDGVSYGNPAPDGKTWRETMMGELEGRMDFSHVHFVGWQDHETLIRLYQRSNAHVYLTYPFVLSWSLREAMAVGCPLVVSDTEPLREYLLDGTTARFVSFFNPHSIASGVIELLEDGLLAQFLSQEVFRYARRRLGLKGYLASYESLISEIVERHRK